MKGPVSFVGWERWKQEHPELLYALPAWVVSEAEKQARADLNREMLLLEIFVNQRVER